MQRDRNQNISFALPEKLCHVSAQRPAKFAHTFVLEAVDSLLDSVFVIFCCGVYSEAVDVFGDDISGEKFG